MHGATEFDRQKFKELVLHLAKLSADDPGFGGVKLNKLLYFCDFEAYRKLGRPITGEVYRKAEYGPVAWHYLPVEEELLRDGLLRIQREEAGPYERKVRVAVEEPDLSLFSSEELTLISEVFSSLQPYDATDVSKLSHEKSAGWKLVEEGEEIPYRTVLISTEPIPEADIERARQLAVERGWAAIHP